MAGEIGKVNPVPDPTTPQDPAAMEMWLPHLLGEMRPKIEGKWFYNASIYLDGYDFVGCRFERCHIWIHGGLFKLTSCRMSDCTYFFQGNAAQVVKVFHLTDKNCPPVLLPQWDANGTVSL